MNIRKAGFALLCALISISTFAQSPSRHIILISIDGLRPEMYKDSTWPAPHLRDLMQQGVYADHMKSVFPAYTYPSHVAMLTGALPARGGIYYNAKPGTSEWNWFMKDIRVPTIWQVCKQAGLTTSAVEWPVSVGSGITWNIPEIWDTRHADDRITEVRKYATPGLIEEIELNATGKLDSINMNEEFIGLDDNAGRMAAYIYKTRQPSLLAVHFAGADGQQHAHGRDNPFVKAAVENIDHAIGLIAETVERSPAKEQTTIIIVGDHGFTDMRQALRPNIWIKDIKAKFQSAGGSCYLYEQEPGATARVVKALDALPDSIRRLFAVYDKQKLTAMGVDSSATLALAAIPGIVFSGATTGEQLTPAKGGHHGYDPNNPEMYTGFIAAGAGIRKGSAISGLTVTDIAPLLARLLGLEFHAPDGILVAGIVL